MPQYKASAISWWPMLTSSIHGKAWSRAGRLAVDRSCPAFSPNPSSRAFSAAARAGIKFDAVSSNGFGTSYHLRDRVDKDRNAYARLVKTFCNLSQEVAMSDCVPAVVGCELVMSVGNECHLCRSDFADHVYELRFGVSLDVQFGSYAVLERIHIATADMSLVGARMDGYALCAEPLAIDGELLDIGYVSSARVTQRGDLIDVYT